MPRINNDSENVSDLYGTSTAPQNLTFRERLMNKFESHEWVRVINVDNEPFRWQYLPTHAEKFEYTPDPMKSTYRDSVEAYELQPKESEVIIGENAYVMIEALYKKMASKYIIDKHPDTPATSARNFNWTDGTAQEKWIKKIYLGKEQPFVSSTPPRAKKDIPATPRLEHKKTNTSYVITKGTAA